MSVRGPLREARRSGALLRVERHHLPWFDGYVMALSADLLLLAVVDDRVRFNGFVALRLDLVTHVECPHPYGDFYERALTLRGESKPRPPEVDASSWPTLLRTASREHTVVTIHRELAEPDVCHVGRIVEADTSRVELREISPAANWDESPSTYDAAEITRLDFGGGYEEALTLVAESRERD